MVSIQAASLVVEREWRSCCDFWKYFSFEDGIVEVSEASRVDAVSMSCCRFCAITSVISV